MEPTENKNKPAGAPSALNAGLGLEPDARLLAQINLSLRESNADMLRHFKGNVVTINLLKAALERIAAYPHTRADELGYEKCRKIAEDALKHNYK